MPKIYIINQFKESSFITSEFSEI